MQENKEIKEVDPIAELVVKYISENYRPLGDNERIDHVTSADIVMNLRPMANVEVNQVTKIMSSCGFHTEFINGKPFWVVFSK